jgi:hypothetical protein
MGLDAVVTGDKFPYRIARRGERIESSQDTKSAARVKIFQPSANKNVCYIAWRRSQMEIGWKYCDCECEPILLGAVFLDSALLLFHPRSPFYCINNLFSSSSLWIGGDCELCERSWLRIPGQESNSPPSPNSRSRPTASLFPFSPLSG